MGQHTGLLKVEALPYAPSSDHNPRGRTRKPESTDRRNPPMCGRITVECDVSKLEQLIQMPVQDNTELRTPTWNGPPGARYRVLRSNPDQKGGAKLDAVRWGLVPRWANDDQLEMINARSETVSEKASFWKAFVDGRGILPVTGWYEWRKTGRGQKQPYRIHLADDGMLLLAVVCEAPRPGGAPRRDVRDPHDRTPR